SRAVQGMHEARLAVWAARARVHAPRLEIATNRAARDLAVGAAVTLTGHPDLDVIGLLRRKTHVSRTQSHHAVMQIELSQNLLGAGKHALMLVAAGLGRRDRHQFDL